MSINLQDTFKDHRVYKNDVEEIMDRKIEDYEFEEIMEHIDDEISEGLRLTLESSLDNHGYLDNPNQIEMDME